MLPALAALVVRSSLFLPPFLYSYSKSPYSRKRSINLKVDFAALCVHEIYTLRREIPMQVTLSGYTGRAASVSDVPRRDDSGFFQIAEAPLAVRVAEDTTDWYLPLRVEHARAGRIRFREQERRRISVVLQTVLLHR